MTKQEIEEKQEKILTLYQEVERLGKIRDFSPSQDVAKIDNDICALRHLIYLEEESQNLLIWKSAGILIDRSEFNSEQIKIIEIGIREELDVTSFANPDIDYRRMLICLHAARNNLDVTPFLDMRFSDDQMCQILDGKREHLDVSVYAEPCYGWEQMREIRLGLNDGLNVKCYANPKYHWRSMAFIRKSLKAFKTFKNFLCFT